MKKIILIMLLLNGLLSFSQSPLHDNHWELLWEDNFDNGFDNTLWRKGDNCDHGGINEKQLYTTNNVFVNTSNQLEIKAIYESIQCPSTPPGDIGMVCGSCNTLEFYDYTSGWVETSLAYAVKYGYLEAKISLPYAVGLWPAFWTFQNTFDNQNQSNNINASEIDIVENFGSKPPTVLGTCVHLDYAPNAINYPLPYDLEPNGYNYATNPWYTYGVEWSPEKIIWYLDDKVIRVMDNPGVNDPVRIIFGMGVQDDAVFTGSKSMLVDYVKVWKLKNDCIADLTNLCNYNFATHDNRVKKSITVGNGSCTNTLNSNDNIFLRAKDYVLINGNFTVPIGAELYVNVEACY